MKSSKQCVVCVLALAGSAVFLLAVRNCPARNHPQWRDRETDARNVSAARRSVPVFTKAKMAGLSIPMAFEPNAGEADARVQFVGRGEGHGRSARKGRDSSGGWRGANGAHTRDGKSLRHSDAEHGIRCTADETGGVRVAGRAKAAGRERLFYRQRSGKMAYASGALRVGGGGGAHCRE